MDIVWKLRILRALLIIVALAPLVLFFVTRPSHKAGPDVPANAMTPKQKPIDPQVETQHQISALATVLAADRGSTPALLLLAKLESEKGRLPEAVRHLREILSREPDNTAARLELGKALFQEGDFVGAVDQTRKILAKHPTHPDALYNLGAIYGNLGDKERALTYWQQLIALNPNSESGQQAQLMMSRLETRDR